MKVFAGIWRRLAGVRPSARAAERSPIAEEDWPEWGRRWSEMPCRRLDAPARFDFGSTFRPLGEPASATIALVPPEHAGRVEVGSRRCPVCGRRVVGVDRRLANLSPKWPDGLTIGVGCWVHPACFEGLPDAETPAPVPW